MSSESVKRYLDRILSPRGYRRLIQAGAILGAMVSFYTFLTLDVFRNALSPGSGRLSATFIAPPGSEVVEFGFENLTGIPVTSLNATFGTYGADGALLAKDYFTPENMTVDPHAGKVARSEKTKISADRMAIYYFCADHEAQFPFTRVREIYLLVPSRLDPAGTWGQTYYTREIWRFRKPDCTPPDKLTDDILERALASTN